MTRSRSEASIRYQHKQICNAGSIYTTEVSCAGTEPCLPQTTNSMPALAFLSSSTISRVYKMPDDIYAVPSWPQFSLQHSTHLELRQVCSNSFVSQTHTTALTTPRIVHWNDSAWTPARPSTLRSSLAPLQQSESFHCSDPSDASTLPQTPVDVNRSHVCPPAHAGSPRTRHAPGNRP